MGMKILITGGQGQLARALTDLLQKTNTVLAWDIPELDFTKHQLTLKKVDQLKPDLIIHCGALTDVRGCELNAKKAYLVNSLGTRNVALAAGQSRAKLVYISTDFVYDGQKTEPYLEFDPVNPLNIYGKSKLAGEQIVQSLLSEYYIVRTAWLYSEIGNNFLQTMLSLAKKTTEIAVVSDQWGTPTYTKELALGIQKIISAPFYGIYHVSNSGSCTWYDFAREIFAITGIKVATKPVSSKDYGDVVARPRYSVLENFNLEQTYGYHLSPWQEALDDCLKSI